MSVESTLGMRPSELSNMLREIATDAGDEGLATEANTLDSRELQASVRRFLIGGEAQGELPEELLATSDDLYNPIRLPLREYHQFLSRANQREVSRFLYRLDQEVRSPLQALLMTLQMFEMGMIKPTNEKVSDTLHRIRIMIEKFNSIRGLRQLVMSQAEVAGQAIKTQQLTAETLSEALVEITAPILKACEQAKAILGSEEIRPSFEKTGIFEELDGVISTANNSTT